MLNFFSILIIQGIKIRNGCKMKHFFWVCYIQAYHRKTYCDFNVTLHSRKNTFCHTKLQTIIIKVVLFKFLYLIANWTSFPKPIKEALAKFKSPLKLLINSSYSGKQLAFLENQINFKSSVYSLVAMATNLHFDILLQHQTFRFMVCLQIYP